MFRTVIRTIALQRIHITREAYQTPRLFARFLSAHQTTSASESNGQQSINQDEPYWRRVFHYPEMQYLSLLSKIKFYPAGAGVAMASVTGILHAFGLYPQLSIIPPLYVGLTLTPMLCIYSKLLSNTVAIINSCPQRKNLQIVYIDYRANRKCIEATVSEVRQMEHSKPKFRLYKTIEMKNDDFTIPLKIPLKNIVVYDVSLFRKMFGKRGKL